MHEDSLHGSAADAINKSPAVLCFATSNDCINFALSHYLQPIIITTTQQHNDACGRVQGRMNKVYDSEDCRIFSQALEHAWEMFLKAGRLTPRNLETAQAALTFAIFHAAADGARNPRGLAKAAYLRIDAYQARIRQERSWGQPLQPAS